MKLLQEQKLEHQLVMTQEMRQSLEILQVSATELKDIIKKEEEENPLLLVDDKRVTNELDKEEDNSIEEYYRDDDNYEEIKRISKNEDSNIDIISKLASKGESILEKIEKEVKIELNSEIEEIISEMILQNIDEKGFCHESIEEVKFIMKDKFNFEVTEDIIENIRDIIMTVEPGGIGCWNVQEYLVFQIKNLENNEVNQLALKILLNNFEELKRKKIRELKKEYNVKEEILKKVYLTISKLKPYPLMGYSDNSLDTEVIIPDVIIKEEGFEFEVYLNDRYLPEIKLNNDYYKLLSQDQEALNYIKEKAMKVRSLEKCIEQRNITIYRVAKEIVKLQREFLTRGEKFLKPLTLYEIGTRLSLHESTISRVVNGKYMQTPKGVFEFKFFFSGKVESVDGEDMSIFSVQKLVKEIIGNESKDKPLTDKEISEMLASKGLRVSKRTVSNYREAMKILPTYLRKEI